MAPLSGLVNLVIIVIIMIIIIFPPCSHSPALTPNPPVFLNVRVCGSPSPRKKSFMFNVNFPLPICVITYL